MARALGEAEEQKFRGAKKALHTRDVLDLRLEVAINTDTPPGIAVEETRELLARQAPGIVDEEGLGPRPEADGRFACVCWRLTP